MCVRSRWFRLLAVMLICALPAIAEAGLYDIPDACMKSSTQVDLDKLNVGKKCRGWYLVKDRAGHGGSKYKACNARGEAKASLASDGKVLRGASKARCF